MENDYTKPTHYYLGIIPCIGSLEPNACSGFTFQDEHIELWTLERLNILNKNLFSITNKSSYIPVEGMDEFLLFIEEYSHAANT